MYGMLTWRFDYQRFVKIHVQKRSMTIISFHEVLTEACLKQLEILKTDDLYDLNCLEVVNNYNKRKLTGYILDFV